MSAKEQTLKKNLAQYEVVNDILSQLYKRVDGCDFYWEIFPNNEKVGELTTDYSKPNAIFLYHDPSLDPPDPSVIDKKSKSKEEKKYRLRRRIMLDDTWEDDFFDYIDGNDHALCGGLAYRGRANKVMAAQQMNALIFDLDGVGEKQIRNLLLRFNLAAGTLRSIPVPTYLVSSGTGVHLYYVFEEPITLFPNIKLQLQSFKHDLTDRIWDYNATSQYPKKQYQSINQSFRMVGSINDKYNVPVLAYRVGEKVTMDYLNSHMKPDKRVDLTRPFRPSKVTKAEAKELYPEWYERVIVNGDKSYNNRKKWDIAGKVHGNDPYALYHWWLRENIDLVEGGHRYFFMMCAVIMACKCDCPKKQVRKDLYDLFPKLKKIACDNELTEDDIKSALRIYSREFYNFTLDDIERLMAIRIKRNKRNYRKQKDHIVLMNTMKNLKKQLGEEVKDGRPKGSGEKKYIVEEWQMQHPDGRKCDCIRETGLSKPTVLKWWNS